MGVGRDGPLGSPPGALGALGAAGSAGVIVGDGPVGVGGGSGAPSPLRPDSASRMAGRRLARRDAAGSRDRHLTREHVPLADVLAG